MISSMNGLQYAVAAWLPIVIFPQTESPTFRRGFPATFGFVIAALICIGGIHWLAVREKKIGLAGGDHDENVGGVYEMNGDGNSVDGNMAAHSDTVDTKGRGKVNEFQEIATGGGTMV